MDWNHHHHHLEIYVFFPVFFMTHAFCFPFQTAGGLELDHQQTLAAYAGKSSDEKLEIQMQVVKFRSFFQKQKNAWNIFCWWLFWSDFFGFRWENRDWNGQQLLRFIYRFIL